MPKKFSEMPMPEGKKLRELPDGSDQMPSMAEEDKAQRLKEIETRLQAQVLSPEERKKLEDERLTLMGDEFTRGMEPTKTTGGNTGSGVL